MLLSFNEVSILISQGKKLHIAGAGEWLKKLPKGNWIGGSTEYFLTEFGGNITNDKLFVTELPYDIFDIKVYDEHSIHEITKDSYTNGFTLVIIPFDSAVHKTYAINSPEFEGMYFKNIMGWISGINLALTDHIPISVDGRTGDIYVNKAIAVHIELPENKTANIGIINVFSQNESSPVIEFPEAGFSVENCLIDGEEYNLADYIKRTGADVKTPIIGNYSGVGINVAIKSIEDNVVSFFTPVFPGIKYKMARGVFDYSGILNEYISDVNKSECVLSCGCILSFLYGEFEGNGIKGLYGPITFGTIAYHITSQSLVYVTVTDNN